MPASSARRREDGRHFWSRSWKQGVSRRQQPRAYLRSRPPKKRGGAISRTQVRAVLGGDGARSIGDELIQPLACEGLGICISPSGTSGATCAGLGRAVRRSLIAVARSATMDTSRIAAFSVLADLPAPELGELAAAMREVEVEAGAKVVTLDDYGTAIYFIEEGEADRLTDSGEATQTLGPGDTLGEIALLLTGERTATVVARTPMRLLSLAGQDFERIRARVPELERSLRRLGVERARR